MLAQGSEIMVVSLVNFRVLAHDRSVPGQVLGVCEKAGGGVLAVACGEAASFNPMLRCYSLPGLKIVAEEELPGGGPVGQHLKLLLTASGEISHLSLVDAVLTRWSKKEGRQTFWDTHKDLFSFGNDYVCCVPASGHSIKVFLENNPRYCLKMRLLPEEIGVVAIAALEDRVHVAVGDGLGRIFLVQESGGGIGGGTNSGPRLVMSRVHWHSLPVRSLRWNGDGKYLYSGGGEAVLVKWNVAEAR